MTMKFKLTPLEKKWILYDVGNSGYAVSICTLLIAIMGPILGAIADVKDLKKKLFELFLLLGVFGCAMLGFVPSWFFFLIVFVLTNTGYSASLTFYDWARIRFIRFKIRHFASESHDDCICHHCFLVAFNDASVIKSISAALLRRKNGKNGFQQPEALDNND